MSLQFGHVCLRGILGLIALWPELNSTFLRSLVLVRIKGIQHGSGGVYSMNIRHI